MVDPLRAVFPNLRAYHFTSPASEKYNCIAWAAADAKLWWWPDDGPGIYWPPAIAKEETISAFTAVFAELGYVPCQGADKEPGFEKVALFADATGFPTHAARELATGRWTSKLGRAEDIEHALDELEGDEYGKVAVVMRRPVS